MTDVGARHARPDEAEAVATTLAHGFRDDPVWGVWAFPERDVPLAVLVAYWWPFVDAAMRYDGVWTADDGGAVALWVPPGVPEVGPDDEPAVEAMLAQVFGDQAPRLEDAYARFEAAHPREVPHWYLSLLATRPDQRGRGVGMALVADRLRALDEAGLPAYLESSNDANLPRYQRAGFRPVGSFTLPQGPTLTTMWRHPRHPRHPRADLGQSAGDTPR